MRIEDSFLCTQCGSTHFGRHGDQASCHGCGKSYSSDQYWMCFVVMKKYENQREYEAAERLREHAASCGSCCKNCGGHCSFDGGTECGA